MIVGKAKLPFWKLLEKIPFVTVKHVNRELNSEAHNLAFLAKIVEIGRAHV